MSDTNGRGRAAFYRAAWRWHFYAGLFVIPFFLILAVTGLMMLWIAQIDGRDGERIAATTQGAPASLRAQIAAALADVPGGEPVKYIASRDDQGAAIFRIDGPEGARTVAVDPHGATVIANFPHRGGWYDWADSMHGTLMMGVFGDRLIETAASLGIMLLATGLYLWWPRGGQGWRAFLPVRRQGRAMWRSLHSVTGIWISVALLFFLISGLSWAGIWGGRMMQAWSTFPAAKYDAVPLSDLTHASLNDGPKEIPWAIEQTPLPVSGSNAGQGPRVPQPVGIDQVDRFAQQIGFTGRYQLNIPRNETGVWTISRDSMSTDSRNPTRDRTVHIDRYSGAMLADMRFADYSVPGKAMAAGIALHMGTLGWWSVIANTAFCLGVIFLCVSGAAMWWLRRPSGSLRLVAPPMPHAMPRWPAAMIVAAVIGLAFPLAGLTFVAVLILDRLVLARVPALRHAFG
ncbi:PepSY domain-containing protein [Paracoccus sp. 1_MG-2023]|uniref:PepSY-associated TM helix domain-containing protein n=1 Tax=unclassified Paracoccus (in: a-proteobacteria) TaxID=2688777 RepID=UPI001C0A1CD0|nr:MULTISPECIES: PepSY domain-containing protein [unclassified Paracoccus (in: a-proteobacteria)]MBU2956610.1 PepSY domain-containing protein [Paracoccus sp. C2R09]MDO6668716.1 PepSY domain-containing protein [Paracoccus sp. 1_MG-2023]